MQYAPRPHLMGTLPRPHLMGTLHQEIRVKSDDLFMEKYPFPEKCLYF